MRKLLINYLEDQGIHYIDALPILRKRLREGIRIYKKNTDGHLDTQGQRAVADFVLTEIKNNDLLNDIP